MFLYDLKFSWGEREFVRYYKVERYIWKIAFVFRDKYTLLPVKVRDRLWWLRGVPVHGSDQVDHLFYIRGPMIYQETYLKYRHWFFDKRGYPGHYTQVDYDRDLRYSLKSKVYNIPYYWPK